MEKPNLTTTELPESIMSMSADELYRSLLCLGTAAREFLQAPETDLYTERKVSRYYEIELIQVAASAMAAVVDLRTARDGLSVQDAQRQVEAEIQAERVRQDCKFGQMPRSLDALVWVAIILEELAEVLEEIDWRVSF